MQEDCHKFKANGVYTVSHRLAGDMGRPRTKTKHQVFSTILPTRTLQLERLPRDEVTLV